MRGPEGNLMTPERVITARLTRLRSRGLTLVETLVVLAIAVLLIGVLLFYVFPSDDYVCKQEANRLAAYIMGAEAEAEMRDGGARVAIDIARNSATRQVTRMGADVTRDLWEEDKKAEHYKVKSPAIIEAVDTPGLPNLRNGIGYVVFMGTRTEGAVVVLSVDKAVYSIIVPPAGGEIRVEKGRASIPGANQFERIKIPDLTGYSDVVKKSKGSFPSGGLPPSSPMTRRAPSRSNTSKKKATSAKDVKKISPPPDSYSPTPSEYESSKPSYPSTPNLNSGSGSSKTVPNNENSADPADEPQQNNEGPCQSYADCVDDGPWRICRSGRCVVWPYERTLMLSSVQVQEPSQLAEVLEGILGNLINEGQLNLMLNLDQPSPWLIQGARTGSFGGLPKYGQSDSFPTYRGVTSIIMGCEAGICQASFRPDNEDKSLTLYIRDLLVDEDSDECKYQPLELIDVHATGIVNVQKQPGVFGQQMPIATMTVRGTVRRTAARNFQVKDGESLLDTLEQYSVPENKDTVGDGVDDGWEFVFQGPARTVFFEGDPTSRTDVMPDGCEL